MNRLLVALFLSAPVTLLAQDNQNYDPDYNGDGCYSIADILGLLPLFGECVEADTTWGCGDSVLFDGYWYQTVLIGGQCWFAENLRTTVYANGDIIPAELTDEEWSSTTSGATAVFGEGDSYCQDGVLDIFDGCDEQQSLAEFGRLYNWYAVDDARGLCPPGWHVSTDAEWTTLEEYAICEGFEGNEGNALKSTAGWSPYISNGVLLTGNGTDDFGFSALPGGFRFGGPGYFSGNNGHWWSATPNDSSAWYRYMYPNGIGLYRSNSGPRAGAAVRCLRDTLGCTDLDACNYDSSAVFDDGSCLTFDQCGVCGGDNSTCGGCMDPVACNFNPDALLDDGSCLQEGLAFSLTIHLDNYPWETNWGLVDSTGVPVAYGGPYTDQGATVVENFCAGDGCYTFTIFDAFGDGILGAGGYALTLDSTVIASGSVSASSQSTEFCTEN